MLRPPTATKIVNDLSQAPADAGPQPEGAIETLSAGSPPGSCSSRGVLDGAFCQVDSIEIRTSFGESLMIRTQANADLQYSLAASVIEACEFGDVRLELIAGARLLVVAGAISGP